MPLLEQAETITILTVNESRSVPADASAAHLVRYLARLGVPTRIAGVTTETANIQSSILSIAADESINLLVMAAAARQFCDVERIEFSVGGERQEFRGALGEKGVFELVVGLERQAGEILHAALHG